MDVQVGKAFLLWPKAAEQPERISSRIGRGTLELAGQTVPEVRLQALELTALLSDRDLYQESRDTVHLIFLDLLQAQQVPRLSLFLNGVELSSRPLEVDRWGMATARLLNLSVGDYVARVGAQQCPFKVAGFRLAPLFARTRELVRTDDALTVVVELTSFDVPVHGGVSVVLQEGSRKVAQEEGMAEAGLLTVRFAPNGQGPFQLQLQLLGDPNCTATLPLLGTSGRERSDTPFSTLEPGLSASLLPEEGSQGMRGLHFRATPGDAPLRVRDSWPGHSGEVHLEVLRPMREARVLVLDPACPNHPLQEASFRGLQTGQILSLSAPRPLAWLVCAGLEEDDHLWEGWAALPARPAYSGRLEMESNCRPRDGLTLAITDGPRQGTAYVVVKDARASSRQTSQNALAACLKEHVQETGRRLNRRFPTGPRALSGDARSLEEALLQEGIITRRQLDSALNVSRRSGVPVARLLRDLGMASERDLAEVLAALTGVEFVEVQDLALDRELVRCIPEHLAMRYKVLAVEQNDNKLRLAMVDPLNVIAVDDIRLITGFDIDPVMGLETEIVRCLEAHFGVTSFLDVEETVKDIAAQDFGPADFEDAGEEISLDRLADLSSAPARGEKPDAPREFPALLFAGQVPVEDGQTCLPLHPAAGERWPTGDYRVEVTLLGDGDWAYVEGSFRCQQSPDLFLQVPAFVQPGERAEGRVRAIAGQGRLEVLRDLEVLLSQDLEEGQEVRFTAVAGSYRATLTDPQGRREEVSALAREPGRMAQLCKTLAWLEAGEKAQVDDSTLNLRVLPGFPVTRIAEVLANYEHSCCEQTAAKMVGAGLMCGSPDAEQRSRGEAVLAAGLKRMQTMVVAGGFSIYPGAVRADTYWGPRAVQHLFRVASFPLNPGDVTRELRQGIRKLAEEAARAYEMPVWPPATPRDAEEAYAVASSSASEAARQQALSLVRQTRPQGLAVQRRTQAAYAAATLLRLGDLQDRRRAKGLAVDVLASFRSSGMLYSTVDSAAALALLSEIKLFGPARLQVDGRPCTPSEAEAQGDISSLQVLEGEVLIESVRIVREDWSQLDGLARVEAHLHPSDPRLGQPVELELRLPEGYEAGDLAWIALPDCLSVLEGGGQIKWLSHDFAGQRSVRLPLAVTSPTPYGKQMITVILRNMFEEERASKPWMVAVEVKPRSASRAQPLRPGWQGVDFTVPTAFHKLRAAAESGESTLLLSMLLARLQEGAGPLRLRPSLSGIRGKACCVVTLDAHEPVELTPETGQALAARALLLAGLSIYPNRPQIGNLEEFTVSFLPTGWGPWLCLRKDLALPATLTDGPDLLPQSPPPRGPRRPSRAALHPQIEDSPIVRVLDLILRAGLSERAQTIRLEIRGKSMEVDFLVDGVWNNTMSPPLSVWYPLVGRLRQTAELDFYPEIYPESGHFEITVDGGPPRSIQANFQDALVLLAVDAPPRAALAPSDAARAAVRQANSGSLVVPQSWVPALLDLAGSDEVLLVGRSWGKRAAMLEVGGGHLADCLRHQRPRLIFLSGLPVDLPMWLSVHTLLILAYDGDDQRAALESALAGDGVSKEG